MGWDGSGGGRKDLSDVSDELRPQRKSCKNFADEISLRADAVVEKTDETSPITHNVDKL